MIFLHFIKPDFVVARDPHLLLAEAGALAAA